MTLTCSKGYLHIDELSSLLQGNNMMIAFAKNILVVRGIPNFYDAYHNSNLIKLLNPLFEFCNQTCDGLWAYKLTKSDCAVHLFFENASDMVTVKLKYEGATKI